MNQPRRTCPKCGASLPKDARFCEECGTPVPAQPARAAEVSPTRRPPKPKNPSTSLTIPPTALIAGGVIGVALIVVLLVLVLTRPSTPSENPIPAASLPSETEKAASPSQTEPAAAVLPPVVPTDPIQVDPSPTDTPLPAATEASVPASPEVQLGQYNNEGIRFIYDPSLAGFIETETLSAQTGDDLPPWELYPEHKVLSLLGYPLSGTFHEPKIFIYPAQDYQAINPAIGDQVANLQQMLIGRRTDFLPDTLPFFTLWNAGQVISSQIKYLDFKNGAGVRYLTQYGQGAYPIDNQLLFYTFQGITSDKNWLISAILPVKNDVLPDPNTLLADPDFFDNYPAYLESAKILLDDLPESSYLPGLTLLDALFQSLEIQ